MCVAWGADRKDAVLHNISFYEGNTSPPFSWKNIFKRGIQV